MFKSTLSCIIVHDWLGMGFGRGDSIQKDLMPGAELPVGGVGAKTPHEIGGLGGWSLPNIIFF